MSDNQYLEIIENKLDSVAQKIDDQPKSEDVIKFLTKELKKSLDEKQNLIQSKLDDVQVQINSVQANLADSLKSPEIAAIFTKLSDTVLEFSRDLNSQTKYFNSTVEDIQEKIGSIDFEAQLKAQKSLLKTDIDKYRKSLESIAQEVNANFESVKTLMESTSPAEAMTAFSGDISLLQKGLNDILSVVLKINSKQGEVISAVADIANSDVENIHFDVSSIIVEIQSIKEYVGQLVQKTDIDILNEKVNYAVSSLSNVKEVLSQISKQVEAINPQGETDIKAELQSLSSYFSDIGAEISNNAGQSISDLVDKFSDISTAIKSKISGLEKILKSTKEEVSSNLDENITRLKEFSQNLVSAISVVSNKMETKNDELKSLVESHYGQINENLLSTTSLIEDVRGHINASLVSNNESLSKEFSDIRSATEEIKLILSNADEKLSGNDSLIQGKEEILEAFKSINEDIHSKLNDGAEKIDDFVSDVKHLLGESFVNISDSFAQDKISDEEFKANLKLELKNSVEEIVNKIAQIEQSNDLLGESFELINSKVDEKIEADKILNDSLLKEMKDSFSEVENKFVEQVKISKEQNSSLSNEIKASFVVLNGKVEDQTKAGNSLLEEIKQSFVNLDGKFNEQATLSENIRTLVSESLTDVDAELKFEELKLEISEDITHNALALMEKFQAVFANQSTNKDLLEKLAKNNANDILNRISELKTEIDTVKVQSNVRNVLPEIKNLSEKVNVLSNDVLNALAENIDESFDNNFKTIREAIEDKISFIRDDIQEIIIKISDIDTITENVKNLVIESFENYLGSFDSDLKGYIDANTNKITSAINEYQQELRSLCDIDLSGYSEETKRFVEEQIGLLKEKVETLNCSNELEDYSNDIKNTVVATSDNINKRLEIIRDIILSEIPSADEFVENFDDFRLAIDELNEKTDTFADVVKSENATLKDLLLRYQAEINAISNLDLSSYASQNKNTQEFIKDELKQLKEQFVRNLTAVFENISFIEESEEIQNIILDNADEIKSEITKLKEDLIANSKAPVDIDEKFDNLKNILESITSGASGDSGKYIYTLPDVEMDIAKMRMAIGEVTDMLKRNKEDGYDVIERLDTIDDIRDDISSISKRTNKLILTSEDANKHLRDNLVAFKKVIDEVGAKCNRIDSTQLHRNISDVKALVMSGLKSDQILNEAFMHLAEWIDDSAKTMNTISTQVSTNEQALYNINASVEKLERKFENQLDGKSDEITKIKDAVSELAYRLEKRSDIDYSKSLYEIEYGLDKLADKLDVQELKIKSLEKKLDSINTSKSTGDEATSLLEFIASQVTAANENSRSNKLLLQKIEAMERQMSQFEISISKITQFVDGTN